MPPPTLQPAYKGSSPAAPPPSAPLLRLRLALSRGDTQGTKLALDALRRTVDGDSDRLRAALNEQDCTGRAPVQYAISAHNVAGLTALHTCGALLIDPPPDSLTCPVTALALLAFLKSQLPDELESCARDAVLACMSHPRGLCALPTLLSDAARPGHTAHGALQTLADALHAGCEPPRTAFHGVPSHPAHAARLEDRAAALTALTSLIEVEGWGGGEVDDATGRSALHEAVVFNDTSMLRYLSALGGVTADSVAQVDRDGETALTLSRRWHRTEAVAVLAPGCAGGRVRSQGHRVVTAGPGVTIHVMDKSGGAVESLFRALSFSAWGDSGLAPLLSDLVRDDALEVHGAAPRMGDTGGLLKGCARLLRSRVEVYGWVGEGGGEGGDEASGEGEPRALALLTTTGGAGAGASERTLTILHTKEGYDSLTPSPGSDRTPPTVASPPCAKEGGGTPLLTSIPYVQVASPLGMSPTGQVRPVYEAAHERSSPTKRLPVPLLTSLLRGTQALARLVR